MTTTKQLTVGELKNIIEDMQDDTVIVVQRVLGLQRNCSVLKYEQRVLGSGVLVLELCAPLEYKS